MQSFIVAQSWDAHLQQSQPDALSNILGRFFLLNNKNVSVFSELSVNPNQVPHVTPYRIGYAADIFIEIFKATWFKTFVFHEQHSVRSAVNVN